MPTITTRLTLWYLAVLGGIVVVVAIVMYLRIADVERSTLDGELRSYADFLMTDVESEDLEISEMYDRLQEVTARANLRFRSLRFFLTNSDSVIYEALPRLPINPLLDSIDARLQGQRDSLLETISVGPSLFRIYSITVPGPRIDPHRLVVVASLERLEEQLSQFRNLLLIVVPFALLAASLGGYFLARRALAPVAELTSTASTITSTNLHRRVPVGRSNDELAGLAMTFNQMIDRLESTFSSQQRFIADASHDLRTPLATLHAELELMLKHHPVGSETRLGLERSIREVDRLARLAGDLLLLARAESSELALTLETCRLDEILVECVASMKTLAARRRVSLRVDVQEPVEVECVPQLLARAVTNVVENAIKYSPEGGQVAVTVGRIGTQATITVHDQGPGIPPEELPKIFDRFYRTDPARHTEGSGLGLAITRAVIESLGGTVSVACDAGTVVTIRLPS